MRRILIPSFLGMCGLAILAAPAAGDVIVRGPFGRAIVIVGAPVDVRVGPGVFVGAPSKAAVVVPAPVPGQPIVSKAAPAIRPETDTNVLPPPRTLPPGTGPAPTLTTPAATTPVLPQNFVKNFKPGPEAGKYDVLFEHPISHKAVSVPFNLPAGNPRVTYHGNLLVFDYGRGHEVTIRFQAGTGVQVTMR